jgi:Flp pilus assembly protein TadB
VASRSSNPWSLTLRELEQSLEKLERTDFRYLTDREEIEELVDHYLASPELESSASTMRLTRLLFESEWKPTERVVRGEARSEAWLYGSPPAPLRLWALGLCTVIVFFLWWFGYPLVSIAVTVLVVLAVAAYSPQMNKWRPLLKLYDDVDSVIYRELASGIYDPSTLSKRLQGFERRGLRVHSALYALLRLLEKQRKDP